MEKDKELIWVDKEFATRYNALKGDTEKITVFKEYLERSREEVKKDYKNTLESMQEDFVVFTGAFLQVKQSFEKAKTESLSASYAMWEEYEKELPSLRKKISDVVSVVKPVAEEVKELEAMMRKINNFALDKVTESFSAFKRLYDSDKEMFEFLIKNFKPKRLEP